MFSIKDLLGMSDYFAFLSANKNSYIEVMSKNTSHCWMIVEEKDDSYTLYHKHKISQEYHFQTTFGSLYDTVLDIVNHDEYQLRNRKPVRFKHQYENSYFNKMVAQYGVV